MTRTTNTDDAAPAVAGTADVPSKTPQDTLAPTRNPLRHRFYDPVDSSADVAKAHLITFSPDGETPTGLHLAPRAPLGAAMSLLSALGGGLGGVGAFIVGDGALRYGMADVLASAAYQPLFTLSLLLPTGILGAILSGRRLRRERTARTIACPASLVDDVTTTYQLLASKDAQIDLLRGSSGRQRALRRTPRTNDHVEPVELLNASGRQRSRERDALIRRPRTHATEQHRRLVSHFISALMLANQPVTADETEARDTEVRRRLAIIDRAVTATAKDNHR